MNLEVHTFVGYLNAVTGNFDASFVFMVGSLLISAILTIFAVKDTRLKVRKTKEQEIIATSACVVDENYSHLLCIDNEL